MTLHSVVLGLAALTALALHGGQGSGVAGREGRRARCGPGRHREAPPAGHRRDVVARPCCADGFVDR